MLGFPAERTLYSFIRNEEIVALGAENTAVFLYVKALEEGFGARPRKAYIHILKAVGTFGTKAFPFKCKDKTSRTYRDACIVDVKISTSLYDEKGAVLV